MPTIAESIQNLHDGATFLHGVATGPATGAGSQVTNPADASTQDSVAKTIADAKTTILTDTYLKANVKEITGTTYTCLAADTGKFMVCTNAGGCTITVGTGLDQGWNGTFKRGASAGAVSFTESGTTIEHPDSHKSIASAKAVVSLMHDGSEVYTIMGQTAV